jgi:hypothetical protein
MNPRCWTRESAVPNCKPLRPSSQQQSLNSKGQSKQTEYIDVSVHEINTKLMWEKDARTKLERNPEKACFMDEHDNRRRGEVDVWFAESIKH